MEDGDGASPDAELALLLAMYDDEVTAEPPLEQGLPVTLRCQLPGGWTVLLSRSRATSLDPQLSIVRAPLGASPRMVADMEQALRTCVGEIPAQSSSNGVSLVDVVVSLFELSSNLSAPVIDCPLPVVVPPRDFVSVDLRVFELDHMRNRDGYGRHLARFHEEGRAAARTPGFVRGAVVSLQRWRHVWIFIAAVVFHSKDSSPCCSFQKWQRSLRSEHVDVDSRGRPCKERLLRAVFMAESPPVPVCDSASNAREPALPLRCLNAQPLVISHDLQTIASLVDTVLMPADFEILVRLATNGAHGVASLVETVVAACATRGL